MNQATNNTKKSSKYFENQKRVWYDPKVSIYVKVIIRLVELHRSDSKGWFLSVRKLSSHLNISTNTCSKAINQALDAGYLEATNRIPRKRRKLRLSVSLRAPIEFESPSSQSLSHWEKQPVSPNDTPTVSSSEPLNNKEISNANINDSHKSQLKTIEIKSPKSSPYKEKSSFTRLSDVLAEQKEVRP